MQELKAIWFLKPAYMEQPQIQSYVTCSAFSRCVGGDYDHLNQHLPNPPCQLGEMSCYLSFTILLDIPWLICDFDLLHRTAFPPPALNCILHWGPTRPQIPGLMAQPLRGLDWWFIWKAFIRETKRKKELFNTNIPAITRKQRKSSEGNYDSDCYLLLFWCKLEIWELLSF